MQKFFSSCHRRSVSFMVVQPRLRFQVLAMNIYHCGIFNIPSFLSENGNSCCLTVTFCFICLNIWQKLLARNFFICRCLSVYKCVNRPPVSKKQEVHKKKTLFPFLILILKTTEYDPNTGLGPIADLDPHK
jgi:hypothetical protein